MKTPLASYVRVPSFSSDLGHRLRQRADKVPQNFWRQAVKEVVWKMRAKQFERANQRAHRLLFDRIPPKGWSLSVMSRYQLIKRGY